jgi:hypothetical protein
MLPKDGVCNDGPTGEPIDHAGGFWDGAGAGRHYAIIQQWASLDSLIQQQFSFCRLCGV